MKESELYAFLQQDGERSGLYGSQDDAINFAWGDFYERKVNAWNDAHFDNEKILGYRIGEQVYHSECIHGPLPKDAEELTLVESDLPEFFCSQCDEPILEDTVRNEYYDHPYGCECDLCMKVAALIKKEPDHSNAYILGYRVGIQHVLREKVPAMTLEQYTYMRGLEGTDFIAGYERGDKEEDE